MTRAWPVHNVDPNATLATNARRILRVRAGEFYSYGPIVDSPAEVEALHNLRIAAKRLRYTLELFRSVFAEVGERNIVRVKAIQEELGNLHDSDVRIALIQEELTRVAAEQIGGLGKILMDATPSTRAALTTAALRPPPDDPRRGLLALLSRQYEERETHFSRFNKLWHEFEQEGMRQELVVLSSTQGDLPAVTNDRLEQAP